MSRIYISCKTNCICTIEVMYLGMMIFCIAEYVSYHWIFNSLLNYRRASKMMFTILKMLFNIDIHHVSCHNMWHRLDLKEQNLEYKVSYKDFMQPIIQCIMRDIVNILIRCQINLLFARLQLQVLWPCYFVILGTLTFFYLCCVAELCFGNNVIKIFPQAILNSR